MALLDQYGRPIDTALLKREQSAPTVRGVRQIHAQHPSIGLTPQRLARILREAEDGDPVRYLELAEDMEEKDLHYLGVLGTRKRAVAQLDITVEAASDSAADEKNAELVRDWLKRDDLEDELFDLLDAVGKGFAVCEIIWQTSAREWRPARLEWRDPRWFRFSGVNGQALRLHADGETEGEPDPDTPGTVLLRPWQYVVHRVRAKSGLPIRGGLARAVAWTWLFKNFTTKDWIVFAEAFGHPLRIGKYGPGATQDERDILLSAVTRLGTDAAAIVPESMQVEIIEAKLSGNIELFEHLADWLDRQVSKAVLGQTLTTEAGDKGTQALGTVHNDVRSDIERSDARALAATLNRDLVRPLVDLNHGPQAAYPRIQIGRPEHVDVAGLSTALGVLVPLGLKVSQRQVRSKIGLDEPEKGDDVLAPPRQPAGPNGGPPPDPDKDERRPPVPANDPGEERQRSAAAQEPGAPATDPRAADPQAADPMAALIERMEAAAQPALDAMIDRVRAQLETCTSMEQAAAAILAAYPELRPAELAATLRQGLAVAELAGRNALLDTL